VLLAIGLFVVARGLSRGRPLLAPFGPTDEDSNAGAGAASDEPPTDAGGEPGPDDNDRT